MTPAVSACFLWAGAWNDRAAAKRVDSRIVAYKASRVREGKYVCTMKVNSLTSGIVACYRVTLFYYQGNTNAKGGDRVRCWDAGAS